MISMIFSIWRNLPNIPMIFAVWRHRVPVPPQRRSDHRLQAVVEIWIKIPGVFFQETNKRPTHTQIDLKSLGILKLPLVSILRKKISHGIILLVRFT